MNQGLDIRERFARELLSREIRAEKLSCLIWIGVILATYSAFWFGRETWQPELVRYISWLVAVTLPAFIAVYFTIKFGYFRPYLTFVNSFLQISLVSGAIYFDTLVYGAQYSLSSMPPLAYGLVIVVTAFRLRPAMGIFSGTLAAVQFLLLYSFMRQTDTGLDAITLAAIPSLGWNVMMMKLVVLLAMGLACSFSALRLRDELQNFLVSANNEMRLEQSLGRYVSSEVASRLVADKGVIPTRATTAVVMFGDIRNFTQYSNHHSPDEVANFLNRFFDEVNHAVESHQGVLNKFLGDGFLAVFGLFDDADSAVERATRAALKILADTHQMLAIEGLGVGLALNRGEVVAGEIGSKGRCAYTVIGNTVNIAARLEAMNRQLGSNILVTEGFAAAVPNQLATPLDHGEFEIRGIQHPVRVIELQPRFAHSVSKSEKHSG